MKKLLIIGLCFILGIVLSASISKADVSVKVGPQVQVQEPYLVQPPAYKVYYYVQPRPYLVTPIVKPRPSKPNFWTPLRNEIWRKLNRPRVDYIITPQ